MKEINLATCALCAAALPSFVHGQLTFVVDHDIQPYVVGGRIETDAVPHGGGKAVPQVRLFGYEFGEDPKDPFFLADPGFLATPGSGLPGGSQLSFNVARHLAYWSGAGNVGFTTPPNDETLRFNFGFNDVIVSGASGPQNGFVIGAVASDGSIHRHLNSLLQGPNSTTDPTAGVYFTNIRLHSSGGSIGPSDSLYLVFNNGLAEPQFDAALEYLADPLPGDANFDGIVTLADFNALAANFGQSDRFWYEGDFNGDRMVTLADFNLLAANFGQSAASGVSVPEPGLCLMTGLGMLGGLRRRHPLRRISNEMHL